MDMKYEAVTTLADVKNYDGGSLIATVESENNVASVYTGYKPTDDWYDEEVDADGDFFMDICDKDYIRLYTVHFKKPEDDAELEMLVKSVFEKEVA